MKDVDESIRSLWDKRSRKYKDKVAGVLPKSFPFSVNQYINNWEFDLAEDLIRNEPGYKILDLGCGYGRLSKRILKKFGKVQALGIDIAKDYVDIYNKNLAPRGHAFVGDIRKLPLADKSINFVLVVTSLMYILRKRNQKKVLREIFRVLKRGGKLLIIERDILGYNLITLWGLISKIRGRKNAEITAVGFDPKDMMGLIKNAGGVVESKFATPFFTLSLPLLFVLNKFKNKAIINSYLRFAKKIDGLLRKVLYPSIYIAYIASKK